MMIRLIQISALALLLMSSAACYAQQQFRTVPTHSGRMIKVTQSGPMFFAGGKNKALMLQYLSEYRIDDKTNLAKEVADIWPSFRFDVENGHYTQAIVCASEAAKPGLFGITNSKSFNFVFEKGADGKWHCATDPTAVKADELYRGAMEMSQKGEFNKVISNLNELLTLWPNSAECLIVRSGCYLAIKEPKKALSDCDKAIAIAPQSDIAYNNRGAAYCMLGDTEHAMKDFHQALKFNPSSANAHMNRGELLLKSKKGADAVKDLSAAIAENPNAGEAYYYRGQAYKLLGNKTEAEKDLAKAKTLKYTPGADTIEVKRPN